MMSMCQKEENLYQFCLNKSAKESIIERIVALPDISVFYPISTKRDSGKAYDKQCLLIKYKNDVFFLGFDFIVTLHLCGHSREDGTYPDDSVFDSLFDLINQTLGKDYILLRETSIGKDGFRSDEINFYG